MNEKENKQITLPTNQILVYKVNRPLIKQINRCYPPRNFIFKTEIFIHSNPHPMSVTESYGGYE